MNTLLTNSRLRNVSLNATLLLIFFCAWASDRFPGATTVAIAIAVVVVAAEVTLLFVVARTNRPDAHADEDCPKEQAIAVGEMVGQQVAVPLASEAISPATAHVLFDPGAAASAPDPARMTGWEADAFKTAWNQYARAVDTLAFTKVLSHHLARMPSEYLSGQVMAEGCLKAETAYFIGHGGRKLAPSALDLLKVTWYGPEVFDLDAGSLMLEHMHGHTVVRIRDRGVVTVEDEPSGWPHHQLPPAAAIAAGGGVRRTKHTAGS